MISVLCVFFWGVKFRFSTVTSSPKTVTHLTSMSFCCSKVGPRNCSEHPSQAPGDWNEKRPRKDLIHEDADTGRTSGCGWGRARWLAPLALSGAPRLRDGRLRKPR